MSSRNFNRYNSGLYADTRRTSFHLSYSQEEQRAAAFHDLTGEGNPYPQSPYRPMEELSYEQQRAAALAALTGEECPQPLNLYRQTKEKSINRSHSKIKKARPKYVFENSSDDEAQQGYGNQGIENWVDGISQSTNPQEFDTVPHSPTTDAMINAAIRLSLENQKASKQARDAQKQKLEQKALGKHTMSSQEGKPRKLKPLGDYTMSSQKAQVPESVYGSPSSINDEPPYAAVRGDFQHRHHHYHQHFHSMSVESANKSGDVWVTRDRNGQLQYQRRVDSNRSTSRQYNESSSDGVIVAKGFSGCQIM